MSKRSELMRQKNRRIVEDHITAELKRFHSAGVLRGAHAMCQVILARATDEKKTMEERLNDVIAFCQKSTLPEDLPGAEGGVKNEV